MSTSALELHRHRWEPATSPDLPTLLLLHGTGGDENDLLPLGRMLLPGAAMLSPRGNVLEQGAPRFFRRLAEGVFDVEDLRRRTGELADFIGAAAERYRFGLDRLYAVGFSNGANVAASLLLSRPQTIRGGVLLRSMLPFEPATLPDLRGRGVLMSQGRQDPIVPVANATRLASLFQESGADVELVWQPAGHNLTNGDVTVAQRWLAARSGAAEGLH
jgi:phospholipase/carboxylesterase